jgi:hypothetical protein
MDVIVSAILPLISDKVEQVEELNARSRKYKRPSASAPEG